MIRVIFHHNLRMCVEIVDNGSFLLDTPKLWVSERTLIFRRTCTDKLGNCNFIEKLGCKVFSVKKRKSCSGDVA